MQDLCQGMGHEAVSGNATASPLRERAGLRCVQTVNHIIFGQAFIAESAPNQGCLQESNVAKKQHEASKTPPTVQQLPFPRRLPVPCRLDRQSPAFSA
jgi:hypothetical protein